MIYDFLVTPASHVCNNCDYKWDSIIGLSCLKCGSVNVKPTSFKLCIVEESEFIALSKYSCLDCWRSYDEDSSECPYCSSTSVICISE